jgi:CRISPR-associated protein Cas1
MIALLIVLHVALLTGTATGTAVAMLLQNEVDVVFFSSKFRYRGRLMSTGSKFAALRHAQLKAMADEAVALAFAKQVVAAKVANQRTVLQRRLAVARGGGAGEASAGVEGKEAAAGLARGRAVTGALEAAVAGIGQMAHLAMQADTLDALRGYEGKAGAHYFAALKAMVPEVWGFTGRAYHPPPDPMNAALSFGYALLLREAVAAVQLVGLDPYLGFLHTIDYGRPSLALDLMEEFRPVLVDLVLLGMLDQGELAVGDFVKTGQPERPIELAPAALNLWLRRFEERMARKVHHPAAGGQTTYRRCVELQARAMAQVVLGKAPAYPGFVIR